MGRFRLYGIRSCAWESRLRRRDGCGFIGGNTIKNFRFPRAACQPAEEEFLPAEKCSALPSYWNLLRSETLGCKKVVYTFDNNSFVCS